MMLGDRSVAIAAATAAIVLCISETALAQGCPAPLADATRLVLVTAATMKDSQATMRLYERTSPGDVWRPRGSIEPAVIGKAGLAWSRFFSQLARRKEPIKVDGDKRAPAGLYSIGRSFGIVESSRANYLQVTPDTICVDDPASPAYNTIASRARVGSKVHAENMSQVLPMYRRGLLVNYPTDAKRKAGSCIFIHVWRSSTTGTAGCVAVPESRVEVLQEFSERGAVLAILPRQALGRLTGCIPQE
jgi:L,D-peptidoglycan transpeptidase YkuD (ErfK/YbiS/YcfS/YnhG family)